MFFRFFSLFFVFSFLCLPFVVFGGVTVSSPANTSFSNATVLDTVQNSSAIVSNVTVVDDRPGSPGWTLVMTSSHFTLISSAFKISGLNNTVTSAGAYNGILGVQSPHSRYILTIDSGGAVGTAMFDVTGSEILNDLVTGGFVLISTTGVRADFDIATYSVGDRWQILVDVFPYTSLTVSPGTITVNSGSGANVTAGSSAALTGTGVQSDAKLLMEAAAGYGVGNYSQNVDLGLQLHANSLSGTYDSEIIFTVS